MSPGDVGLPASPALSGVEVTVCPGRKGRSSKKSPSWPLERPRAAHALRDVASRLLGTLPRAEDVDDQVRLGGRAGAGGRPAANDGAQGGGMAVRADAALDRPALLLSNERRWAARKPRGRQMASPRWSRGDPRRPCGHPLGGVRRRSDLERSRAESSSSWATTGTTPTTADTSARFARTR